MMFQVLEFGVIPWPSMSSITLKAFSNFFTLQKAVTSALYTTTSGTIPSFSISRNVATASSILISTP
uniref:Uncharacterized protein n=1 Tax=Arundo donax TaxID=35708 RepID=A0A0A8XR93_ARUDO